MWGCVDVDMWMWRFGDVVMCRCGGVGLWRCGCLDVDVWRCG